MTTRALEDNEIKAIFDCVEGCNATRNRAMLRERQIWRLVTDSSIKYQKYRLI